MNSYKKPDRRVSKTRNAITNTLLQMMEKQPLSEITISSLTERANVNRKTFYNHYESVDAVLSELENNCSNWVLSFVDKVSFEHLLNHPAELFTDIAKGLQRHSDLLYLLHDSGVYSRLSGKISDSIKATILKKARSESNLDYLPTAEHLLDFVTAGVVGIYDRMYDKEDPLSIDDVTVFFKELFENFNYFKLVEKEVSL